MKNPRGWGKLERENERRGKKVMCDVIVWQVQ
jgi:hypothetical protein